jgi:hypothetical protein
LNDKVVGPHGSQTVTSVRNTKYTITVFYKGTKVKTSSTSVVVDYPARVVIDQNTVDPVGVLVGALQSSANPTQTIELCNVDLDLTGYTNLPLINHRSLIASPACARGPRSFGPRIFVTDKRRLEALFVVYGDNVVISGFRLDGPTSDIESDDHLEELGIEIWPSYGADPVHHIEISNMEISHWSGAGIYVTDNQDPNERGRLFNTNVGAVDIKNNYFHHNRHYNGQGYGVDITGGAYALIEQNVFEQNRHAITANSHTGNDYAGYTARDNLILPGGGQHSEFWGAHTHQIDMHGDQNNWYSGDNWECGTAGETIIIERNTVLYTDGPAIKIRGNPTDKAVVDNNVFAWTNSINAIVQNGDCNWFTGNGNVTNPIDIRSNNIFGATPMSELGSCDFFGDGQLDQFMATGVTWWAKSPITNQWRYLNAMSDLLPQLQLQRIDRDAVCDVAPKTSNPLVMPKKYSSGGTGPWVPWSVLAPE